MSSCSGIGLSSSTTSIFSGGLCSGTTRRPSMFTAKYRLREERKKVLKVSLNKVRRIEDPESFLRRSVLINNTVKRLQREVREEKMVRNGGYMSKLSSMHSFRKSFASSRLQELVHADDLIDDSSSLCNSSLYGPPSSYPNTHNSRKRPLTEGPESDVEEVLSQIYNPPTPCIISAIEESDPSVPSPLSLECLSPSPDSEIKKARMTIQGQEVTTPSQPTSPARTTTVPDLQVEDFEIDVDVVGDVRSSWNNPSRTTQSTLNASETPDEVMDEFRLDFHLTSPTSGSGGLDVLGDTTTSDPPKLSEEMKENTCESSSTVSSSSLSCCPPGLNVSVPLADLPVHQHKCPNSAGISSSPLGSPLGTPETNTSPAEKQQFSSCGHSSIFGELQSVVFHSLIASLET